jgi:hypothetical protein
MLRPGDKEFLASLDSDPVVMRYVYDGPVSDEEALEEAQIKIELARSRSIFRTWLVELRDERTPLGWVQLTASDGPDRDGIQVGAPHVRPLS